MQLNSFFNQVDKGEVKFAWVDVQDDNECPDCFAIVVQQNEEGATMDEWTAFGLPGAGHTVCASNCRCQLVPLLYIETSQVLDMGIRNIRVSVKEVVPTKTENLINMIEAWTAAGLDRIELNLMGLTFAEQEAFMIKKLKSKGIPLPEGVSEAA